MALLLAMYQKMRLIREYNQESLNLMRFSSKVDRIAKNIKNVQKMYEGKMKILESQAKMMQSQASIFFQNRFQIGANSINTNYMSYNGMNEFIYTQMKEAFKNGIPERTDRNGNTIPAMTLGEDLFEDMYEVWSNNNGSFYEYDGNTPKRDADGNIVYMNGFTEDEVKAFNMAMQSAKMLQSQNQMNCNQYISDYQNGISIWLDAQKAQLEAEQDAALEPLEYEQTMMELDKEASEERCQRLKAEMESYTQLVSEEAKNAAPRFGLG